MSLEVLKLFNVIFFKLTLFNEISFKEISSREVFSVEQTTFKEVISLTN